MTSLCLKLLILAAFWTRASAASFLPLGVLSWFWQGSVVVNKWLYIDSGEMWLAGNQVGNDGYWGNVTYSIDLSKPWTTEDLVPLVNPHTAGKDMLTRQPTMWYDSISNTVFWYGGWPYEMNVQPAVWGFTPNDAGNVTWSRKFAAGYGVSASKESNFSSFTETAGALWATSPTKYYSLGGFTSKENDPAFAGLDGFQPALPGLVTYDFQTKSWGNSSSSGYHQSGLGVRGQAIFVPMYGKQGVIVFIGGDSPTSPAFNPGAALVSMMDITIFDIDTGKFYTQVATGPKTPVPRTSFCAVGQSAADNSTFEIFVYGGFQGGDLNYAVVEPDLIDDLSRVWILTLPAFTWIQTDIKVSQRAAHRCEIIGNRQMISIGGHIENDAYKKDSWTNSMGIFDMTNLTWGFNYNPDAAPYARSNVVKDYYADAKSPFPGTWNNPTLSTIFEKSTLSNVTALRSPTATSGVPQTGTPLPDGSSSTTNTGAIVGGAVGAIVAIVSILLGIVFWRKRMAVKVNGMSAAPDPEPDMLVYQPHFEVDAEHRRFEMGFGMIPEMDEQRGVLEMNGLKEEGGVERRMTEGSGLDTTA
ncbi:hypothetical protein IFR05_003218 [Cadophora sp. M221]|nr:hypothetical protein IFR05_003218 [Cadophora sp. M221]